jgi:hypothetical protein
MDRRSLRSLIAPVFATVSSPGEPYAHRVPAPVAGDPLLAAILTAAADATQAGRGWMFAVAGDQIHVVAGHGPGASSRVGAKGPRQFGWAGFVVGTRQALAIVPSPDDPRFLGDLVADRVARPASLLCFPCTYQGVAVGALQLEDKAGGAPFVLDDIELVTILTEIAGAAIADMGDIEAALPPSAEDLGAELVNLAGTHPARYHAVATIVDELLERS